ncbi:MAG TPA: metallophosphoesterase [Gaiellaceae bacterium]|nr:metallophosphoesterase [Gaiellaceae bacterium]
MALAVAWGLFEAGWVRLRQLEVVIPGLPAELDGLRIAHLSDFHLGTPSPGARAVARAIRWVAQRRPDLTVVTGDLLSRPDGHARLLELLARLDHPYVVLGNHDFADSRDPFSREAAITELPEGTLLFDETVETELRGRRVELAGVDPRTWMAGKLRQFGESDAELRILLCHFPRVLDKVPPGRFQLILSGHIHAGQIVIPYGFGRLNLAHPRARFASGLYRREGTEMHVSPGLGTTFVPFRFFARPEATELTLRSA